MSRNIIKKIDLDKFDFMNLSEIQRKIGKRLGSGMPMPSDLPLGEWTEQSLRVLSERYLRKNSKGEVIESPEEMCWRVSWEMASAEILWGATKKEVEKTARNYYEMLVSKRFLPNSPTLMNAGTGSNLQYSACFVIPIEDSLTGIFDAVKYQALIHQSGGGTGFSFSRLRPKGSIVRSSKGVASGPVSFMKIFDAATNEIKQGGKRRGANMGILRVDHPDILEFIHCKEDGGITNFNISVALTDKFMEAYENHGEYELTNPQNGEVVGTLDARTVFNEIAEEAWKTGDPGIVFIDRINDSRANPVPGLGPIESTNPCGEQPLYPYDSCNLGSIFLTYFVKEYENGEGKIKDVNWEDLRKTTRDAIKFMDSVIEMNPYTLPQIRQTSLAIRRIGLGVGGWADLLVELGIPYDSDEALNLAEKVMKTIQEEADTATKELAKTRGAFPLFKQSVYKKGKPRRNSTVTTIAPTGSISIIAGTSSGIEPLFAICYQHVVKDKALDRTLTFFNPQFEKCSEELGFLTEKIKDEVVKHGTLRNVDGVPEKVKKIFGTAHEIGYEWHIKTQAFFQKYTENAVSKTINLPKEASVKEVKKAYLLSWKTGCNGVTVFRDGCKDIQVLNAGVGEKSEDKVLTETSKDRVAERPYRISGSTYKINTPVGRAFVTINEDNFGQPMELFINVGKAGSDVTAMAEALGRTISLSLQFRGSLTSKERAKEIALQLAGIGGRRSVGFGPNKILSLPDAVAMALSNHFGFRVNGFMIPSVETSNNDFNGHANIIKEEPEKTEVKTKNFEENLVFLSNLNDELKNTDICPSCGANAFVYEEGCSKCHVCGHSEC